MSKKEKKLIDFTTKKALKTKNKDVIEKNNLYDHHIIPNVIFRALFIGKTMSGKSNLIIFLLNQKKYYKRFFDEIHIFCPTVHDDATYKQYMDETKDTVIPHEEIDEETIMQTMEEQKRTIDKMGIRFSKNILFIFDDIITDGAFKKKFMKDLFFRGRHYNINIFLSSQSYKEVPRALRLQASNIFVFKPSADEVLRLAEEQTNALCDKKLLSLIIEDATKEKYSFIHINKQTDPENWYRQGLDKVYTLSGN